MAAAGENDARCRRGHVRSHDGRERDCFVMLEASGRCATLGCTWEKVRLCRSCTLPFGRFRDGDTQGAVFPLASMAMPLRRRLSVHTRACLFAFVLLLVVSTLLLHCFDWPSSKLVARKERPAWCHARMDGKPPLHFPCRTGPLAHPHARIFRFHSLLRASHVHCVANSVANTKLHSPRRIPASTQQ